VRVDLLHSRFIASVGVIAWLLSPIVLAHHSYAMFDAEREITLVGTVKEIQWSNPHVFIDLRVPSENGENIWSVELTSPSHLVRNGWKPTTIKAGEPITIIIHPLRDGRTGGSYISATRADGTPLVKQVTARAGAQP
jgi:Family of unknown function (DUF6152)